MLPDQRCTAFSAWAALTLHAATLLADEATQDDRCDSPSGAAGVEVLGPMSACPGSGTGTVGRDTKRGLDSTPAQQASS